MELEIRPVRLEGAEDVVAILNPIIQAGIYTVLDAPLSADEERAYVARFPSRGAFYVAFSPQRGRIVGLESAEPFSTYTHAFEHVGVIGTFVDLTLRRHGIGSRRSQATFAATRRLGYEKIFPCVRADNVPSLVFHVKLGHRIVGAARRQARVGTGYVDEIIIVKPLPSGKENP